MRARIQQELALLRRFHDEVEHAELNGEDWFKLAAYRFPPGWRVGDKPIETGPVIFKFGASYPTQHPYGFCVPEGITFNGTAPNNAGGASPSPFPGGWIQFSWQPDGNWMPTADAEVGSNVLSWVRSFAQRLKEGA
jgi:hypothetical protein